MNIKQPDRFLSLLAEAEQAEFCGWDFSWLNGRLIQEAPPWDYSTLAKQQISKAHSILDMGTGGGELLATLTPLPPDTHATETYPPNQMLASKRLAPLGVQVHPLDEETSLPFSNDRFDLVLNRHESFDPTEVFRVLKEKGWFITQQVGALDNLELNQVLEKNPSIPYTTWGLASASMGLYETGFDIKRSEKAVLKSTFRDIGAVAYYLKAIPWQVAGFTTESHLEQLSKLHNLIERQGPFVATAHRFLIIAQKKEIQS